jgi:signal transduction histidine kinase/putative methionine-R-sulfoxide reductase with GAF domain
MTIAATTPKPLPAAPAEAVPARAPPRAGRLFRKYVALFTLLIGGILIASGLVEMWFSYQENKQALAAVQREKAAAGAQRIEQFIDELRRQIGWTTRSAWSPALIEQRQIDYFQLLRQALPITEISHLDAGGREDLKVSRVGMNTIGSGVDYSADPRFVEAKRHKVWFSPVYFLRDTEPYMTLAIAGAGRDGGVTVTEINLKFIWDPITRIRAGKAGYAYVVDGSGHLIAHPDLGLVLRKTDLSHLPQVAALRAPAGQANGGLIGQGIGGGEVVTAHAAIPVLGWTLFVDLPIAEAFAPVYESLLRSGLLILVGLVLAIGASLLLSRRIVGPIQALTAGAARIGSGELAHRIDIRTDDELQDLAVRFNAMAEGLQESYGQLERRVEERTRELSDALAVQTATSDVLKVISRSAFDLDAVLNTLVDTAGRLCSAGGVYIYRPEADGLRMAAIREVDPLPPGRFHLQSIGHGTATGRAALDRRTVQILDVLADPDFEYKDEMREYGFRTFLAVPLLREDTLIGVMTLGRTRVEGFTQREIDLVTVFADQAVIAIENARLVQELRESLAYQTATGEVLKVISRSAFELDTVLTTLADTAARLCNAPAVRLYRREGDELSMAASSGHLPAFQQLVTRRRIDRSSVAGRAAAERHVVQVLDVQQDPEHTSRAEAQVGGVRTVLAVPLLREGTLIGVISLTRTKVEAFSQREIDLVTVFADQAVIAIENARLLQEIQARTAALAQSVDELRALGESGRSVVATLDLGRVLDTIMDGAVELGRADAGAIFRYTRPMREFSLWRAHGLPDDYAARLGAMQIPAAQTAMGAALIEDKTRELDIEESPLLPLREATISAGFRHVLVVPLIRGKRGYGAMVLYYADRDSVPERAHDLMQTFASQSVVAIQNARLFREIAEKSRELEVASQHKSQFLANMSHELRTPMNAILGYTELMLDGLFGEVNADMKETLDRVQQNGKHLLSLINDVLDLSKIEAGRLELTFADYDANTVVQSVMAAARPLAEAKSIAIAAEVAPDLPLGWGDERRLMQVLLNFASNAVKFTDKGSVQIAARGRDGAIEFAVTDTGPGIDPKDQARIFEEFQQADNSITREKGGTGLGLAISKRIVEMHGGTISVESRLGHGATFRAVVPVRADAGEAAA